MSTTDKTGKQLLDSIRKTKAGPSTAAAQNAKTTAPDDKPAAAKPAAVKPAAAAAKKAPAKRSTAAKPAAAKKPTSSSDPYQSSRRIWPD